MGLVSNATQGEQELQGGLTPCLFPPRPLFCQDAAGTGCPVRSHPGHAFEGSGQRHIPVRGLIPPEEPALHL